ncbi:hypothetical protein K439DRAFT_1402033 [Ramaria rubella]|nr:hypothetical protein K439DRAFT_1402033 [Ramaria rubella]
MKTNFLVCALCAAIASADSSAKIYHRIWIPSSPPPSFSLRAIIHLGSLGPVLTPAPENEIVHLSDRVDGSLYQIALEREGDTSETDWDLSSVKACHLAGAESDVLHLHILHSNKEIYALDYFVRPTPHDGGCPKALPGARSEVSFKNTTVLIRSSSIPPSPEFRAPPQLSPKGEPIQPEPEKSFIQKYWMYIALGLVTLVLTGGGAPDDEPSGQPGQVPATGGR